MSGCADWCAQKLHFLGGALWLAWSWLVAWLVLASKPGPCVGLLAIHCPTIAVQWTHALAHMPQTWGMMLNHIHDVDGDEIQVGKVCPPELGYKKPPPPTKGFAGLQLGEL